MTEKIIIAGAGGQGIMLLGEILAKGAMREDKFVTWIPSYGAEVRGGTAHCMVIISDQEIGSPYIDKADTLIIMNNPSLDKFKGRLKYKGLLIVNSFQATNNIVKFAHTLKYPFTDIAIKLGDIRVANMVALGCFIAQRKIVKAKSILKIIQEIAPPNKKNLIGLNKKALSTGIELNDKS